MCHSFLIHFQLDNESGGRWRGATGAGGGRSCLEAGHPEKGNNDSFMELLRTRSASRDQARGGLVGIHDASISASQGQSSITSVIFDANANARRPIWCGINPTFLSSGKGKTRRRFSRTKPKPLRGAGGAASVIRSGIKLLKQLSIRDAAADRPAGMTSSLLLTRPEKRRLKSAEGFGSRLPHRFLNDLWKFPTPATCWSLTR